MLFGYSHSESKHDSNSGGNRMFFSLLLLLLYMSNAEFANTKLETHANLCTWNRLLHELPLGQFRSFQQTMVCQWMYRLAFIIVIKTKNWYSICSRNATQSFDGNSLIVQIYFRSEPIGIESLVFFFQWVGYIEQLYGSISNLCSIYLLCSISNFWNFNIVHGWGQNRACNVGFCAIQKNNNNDK